MFCIKCGTQLPDEANFCDVCGNKVLRRSSHAATTNMDYDAVASKAEDVIINDDALPLDMPYSNDVVQEKAEFIGENYSSAKIEYTPTSNTVREQSFGIERKYNQIEPYSEGLAAVERNGKWGFIDENGKEVISIIYDSVDKAFGDSGIIWVELNGKIGFIDINGSVVFPFKYDLIFPMDYKRISLYNEQVCLYNEGRGIMARLNSKFGFVDIIGNEVVPLKYDAVQFYRNGYAPVKRNNKWGFINAKGEEIIPLKYDDIDYCLDNIAKVTLNGKCGFVKYDGTEIISLDEYDEISDFKNNVAIIKQNNKYGYIAYDEQTKSLQIMIDCILEYAGDFETTTWGINAKTNVSEWVALILYDGEALYINRSFDKFFESTTKSLGFLGELLIAIFCLLPGFMFVYLFDSNMDITWWNTLILIVSFAICRFIGWPLFVKREEGAYAASENYYIKNRKIMKR